MAERLQKILSARGVASRRKAEEMIQSGLVKVNGEAVYTGKLASLIDKNEIVSFDETLWANNPQTMTVVYTMPYETGDEAQGTTADFDIHLKIQKI